MTSLLIALMVIGQVSTVQPTVVDPSEWSHYEVVRVPSSITIDGVLTGDERGKSHAIEGFSDVFQPERPVKQPTRAALMWDDKYLYVFFECIDDDIWATMTEFDSPIWQEEAVEVFLDPEGRGRHYWEIDVSPRNVVVDLMIPRAGALVGATPANKRYNVKGLLTGVKVYGSLNNRGDRDEKWTVEIAIPWSDFAGRRVNVPPKDGDSWRIQLFRIDRPGRDCADEQFLSWSKSPGVFHQPKNFGVITFRR